MTRAAWRRLRAIGVGLLYTLGLLGGASAVLPVAADAAPLSLSVGATSPYGGATGVTWVAEFVAPSTISASQPITITTDPVATFSPDPADITVAVNALPVAATVITTGSQVSAGEVMIVPAAAITQGSAVRIQMLNTVNPAIPAGQTQAQVAVQVAAPGPVADGYLDLQSATTSVTGGANTGSGQLAVGQPLPPLPAAELPGVDSTSSSFSRFVLTADNAGPPLAFHDFVFNFPLDTTVPTVQGRQVYENAGGTTYYLIDAAAVEIPVQCTSNPGWLVACNVTVTDANGLPWPDLRVIDVSGGTVTAPYSSYWQTAGAQTQTMQQVAINPPEPTSPAANPQTAVQSFIASGLNTTPVNAPQGLTLIPLSECTASPGSGNGSGGASTVHATLLIPLNGLTATIRVSETVVATGLNQAEYNGGSQYFYADAQPYNGLRSAFQGGGTGAQACGWQAGIAQYELSLPVSLWKRALGGNYPSTTSAPFFGTLQDVNQTGPGDSTNPNYYVDVEYAVSMPIHLAQVPAAEVQLPVMPYKILYQPPGDNGHSQFALTQSQTSQTDFELGQTQTQVAATSNELGWTAGLTTDGFGASYSGSWDQTTTQANASQSSSTYAEAWTSEFGQQWQSYSSANNNGLPQLDTPGAQPWLYDEFVLKVHPQFAIYDNTWCADGATDCGLAGNGTQYSTSAGPGSGTLWTLLGAQQAEFDVRAGALLACAQGTPLPIPGTSPVETLGSAECRQLLNLDPFASAAAQSFDPSSDQPGAIGPLAIPVTQYAAGEPGNNLGTNGSYTLQLSQTQVTTNATKTSQGFTSSIDAAIANGSETELSFPVEGLSGSAGLEYKNTITKGESVAVSYTQSQTDATTTRTSAEAMLSDLHNPITTTVFLDSRWDTLMFQVPQPTVGTNAGGGVSPSFGLATGGGVLAITGTGFYSGPVGVQFCPGASGSAGACIPAESVTVASTTALTAIAPPLQPGTYCIQVVDAGGPSACGPQSAYSAMTVAQLAHQHGITTPIVSSVAPASGPDGGGTTVTLSGANLTGVQQVWFGTSDPSANPGLYRDFESTAGTGSLPTLARGPFATLNDGAIVACAPPVAGPETVWVSVYSQTGWSAVTSADKFSYTAGAGTACNPATNNAGPPAPPAVTGVSPSGGAQAGGNTITVSGSGFADVPDSVACTLAACPQGSTTTLLLPPPVQFCTPGEAICATATNVQVIDANTMQVQVPPSEVGTGTVDVEVEGAGGWSAPSAQDQYTYTAVTAQPPAPAGSLALGATPAQAAAALGSTVLTATLLDSQDQPVDHAPVEFTTSLGQISVAGAVYTDGGGVAQVTLTSPGAGTAEVAAEVYGSPTLLDRTQVTFDPVPIVTGLSTGSGPAAGGSDVTIQGQGFTGATRVYFGIASAESFTISPDGTSISAVSPPGLGTVDVRVANPAAESGPVAADAFTYTSSGGSGQPPLTAPVVTGISPSFGPEAGGTTVTITGSGFTDTSQVYFNNTPATSPKLGPGGVLTVVSPPGTGMVDVTVDNTAGASGTSRADRFTYLPRPTVTSVGPSSGPLSGGTTVTIGGTGLGAVTSVAFGGVQAARGSITVVSDDEIQVSAPAGTTPGAVAVTVDADCTVAVATPTACGGSLASPAAAFTYLPPPVVSQVNPGSGQAAGGQQVTISGSGFTTATAVRFGGVAAPSFSISSDGDISATTPATGQAGAVDVTVTTACASADTPQATSCGTSGTSSADRFTYGLPAPAVTSVTPDHGSAAGGSAVTIRGSGFTSGATVAFGAAMAHNATVVSASEITVTAPAGPAAGGVVDVTVSTPCGAGAATSCGTSALTAADAFTYYPASAQVVTRTLQPGWNTLSIPFPLAAGDQTLVQVLGGTRPLAALAFADGHWRLLNPNDPQALDQPMLGLYVDIGGGQAITATLIPVAAVAGSGGAPTSPSPPPTLQLAGGWNLVGPSAALGSESYSQFLTGPEPSSVAMLVDPNVPGGLPVSQPAGDTSDVVMNGYAYWVYEVQGGQTLVGQIATGTAPGGSQGGGAGH